MREMSNKDIRKKIFEKARWIVVKVGSSILASPEKGLQHEVFSHLAKEILGFGISPAL
jgi:glutamate 5-kinase